MWSADNRSARRSGVCAKFRISAVVVPAAAEPTRRARWSGGFGPKRWPADGLGAPFIGADQQAGDSRADGEPRAVLIVAKRRRRIDLEAVVLVVWRDLQIDAGDLKADVATLKLVSSPDYK
jgi:hypothetical protein